MLDTVEDIKELFALAGIEVEKDFFRHAKGAAKVIRFIGSAGDMCFECHDGRISLWSEGTVDELINLATDLLKKNPNARHFGLGTSSSYLVYAISGLARAAGNPVEVGYIPFSDGFVERTETPFPDVAAFEVEKNSLQYMASLLYRDRYRQCLKSMGFYPETIVERFVRSGQKTLIVDNVQKGESFASFIYLIHAWAAETGLREIFPRAIDCIALTAGKFPGNISISATGVLQKLTVMTISPFLRVVINANLSENSDRFVPYYSPKMWGQLPEDIESKNWQAVSRIKKRIDEAIVATPEQREAVQSKARTNELVIG